jgi:enediyne biosynthesis protein E4
MKFTPCALVALGPVLCALSGPAALETFTDVTSQAGITWKNFNGESEDRFLIETMSGGVAFFDYDSDGLPDLYLVNGGETPRAKSDVSIKNALYHNLGNGHFEEVALKAGVDSIVSYGMGAAAADYDNDGAQDLFVTGFPSCQLFHNNGNGTFTDVTEKAGVKNAGRWGASAVWFDFDRDGLLDLFVCNYAQFSFSNPRVCEHSPGARAYCEPENYDGQPPTLYRNKGDGTFADVSAQSGVQRYEGRAFGVLSIDVNEDGWPDLFVACDTSPNLLLVNQHDGTFKDYGLDAGVAYNPDGLALSGMGVDGGDVNGDGRPDFVVTNFNDQHHSLYLNLGKFPFENWTLGSGLSTLTRLYVGWGVRFMDYDNDGDLDLFIVNGHVNPMIGSYRKLVTYKEPPLLLANDGKGVFRSVADAADPVFQSRYAARGMAMADFDNDGDSDVVFACLNDKPVLLRNNVGQDARWIGFHLQGTKSNRDAIGARVTIDCGEHKLVRWVTGGGSFLASQDRRVVFGLGGGLARRGIGGEILWPNGERQSFSGLLPRKYHKMVEP